MEVRPHVCAALAASLAHETLLNIGKPDIVSPSIGHNRQHRLAEGRARRSARPSSNPVYLGLDDMPSNRKVPALTPDEQAKLKQELAATRDRQTTSAKAKKDSK